MGHCCADWVTALVYLTVAVTVLSGADYLFGLRRRMSDSSRTRGAGATGTEA